MNNYTNKLENTDNNVAEDLFDLIYFLREFILRIKITKTYEEFNQCIAHGNNRLYEIKQRSSLFKLVEYIEKTLNKPLESVVSGSINVLNIFGSLSGDKEVVITSLESVCDIIKDHTEILIK